MPFTETSHPKATRTNCSNATSEKTTTATVVKGFIVTSATFIRARFHILGSFRGLTNQASRHERTTRKRRRRGVRAERRDSRYHNPRGGSVPADARGSRRAHAVDDDLALFGLG